MKLKMTQPNAIPPHPPASAATTASSATASGAGDSATVAETAALFDFSCLADTTPTFATKDAQQKLKKWNLDGFWQLKRYSFQQKLDTAQLAAATESSTQNTYLRKFLLEFFNSPDVQRTFQVAGPAPKSKVKLATIASSLGPTARAREVQYERLPVTITSMEFFDRLEDNDLSRNGYVRQCAEEVFDGVTVADEVRNMLVNEDSEHCFLFDDSEQRELLFRIFKHLAIGGSMCQWENRTDSLLALAQGFYKDLLTVHRSASTGGIEVASIVVDITGLGWCTSTAAAEAANGSEEGEYSTEQPWLFPNSHAQNFCYLVICPLKRSATIWYHAYTSWW